MFFLIFKDLKRGKSASLSSCALNVQIDSLSCLCSKKLQLTIVFITDSSIVYKRVKNACYRSFNATETVQNPSIDIQFIITEKLKIRTFEKLQTGNLECFLKKITKLH